MSRFGHLQTLAAVRYLHLEGVLEKDSVQGDYVSFGLGGGTRLGYFSAKRRQ